VNSELIRQPAIAEELATTQQSGSQTAAHLGAIARKPLNRWPSSSPGYDDERDRSSEYQR